MKNCLLIIFYLIFATQRMFMIIAASLFGYCFGYYLFEIFKYKNKKDDIDKFFSSYNKKYGTKHRAFDKKRARH